jgi:hypothetical protein
MLPVLPETIKIAIDYITKYARTPVEKKLARLALNYFKHGMIKIENIAGWGAFDPITKTISMSGQTFKGGMGEVIDTLIHEIFHAAHNLSGNSNDLIREETEAWNIGRTFSNRWRRENGLRQIRSNKPFTPKEILEDMGYNKLKNYQGHTGSGSYNPLKKIRRVRIPKGTKLGKFSTLLKPFKFLLANPKILAIILAIILLAVGIFFLVKWLNNRKPNNSASPSLPTPTAPVIPPTKDPLRLFLTYQDIHFIKDTRFFLSEGNYYTDTLPDMSEGRYQDRISTIANDMKNILASKPDQIFIISGYAADIPGFDQGKKVLAEERVEKVKNLLVEQGVPLRNLHTDPVGGTDKWGDNLKEETRRPNRVVTIEIK